MLAAKRDSSGWAESLGGDSPAPVGSTSHLTKEDPVRRILFTLAVLSLVFSVVSAPAQETPASPDQRPAATRSQVECTGFIAETPVPRNLFVAGGGDDDFRSVVRQFVQGESIFFSKSSGQQISLGAEYRVVRPAKVLFETMRYQGEAAEIHRLGTPYEDVALVKVTHLNPQGVVAKVTLSCEPIVPGDSLISYQARVIPPYTLSKPLDHFMVLDENSKQEGRIIASRNNFGDFGHDTVIYVDLGERAGTTPGRRLRIYKNLPPVRTGVLSSQRTPPETVGEAVVLSVEHKTCVAMIVSSYREIAAGDYVELE